MHRQIVLMDADSLHGETPQRDLESGGAERPRLEIEQRHGAGMFQTSHEQLRKASGNDLFCSLRHGEARPILSKCVVLLDRVAHPPRGQHKSNCATAQVAHLKAF